MDRYEDWLVVQHNVANSDQNGGEAKLPPWPTSAETALAPLGLEDLLLPPPTTTSADDDEDEKEEEEDGDERHGGQNSAVGAVGAAAARRGRGCSGPVRGVYYSMAPRDRSMVPTEDLLRICTPRLLPSENTNQHRGEEQQPTTAAAKSIGGQF